MATTPLIEASTAGDVNRVHIILDAGFCVNGTGGPNSETALHYAARAGKIEVVRVLIDRGANLEIMGTADELNESGGNAFMEACRWGHTEIAELLIARGCNLEARDTHGGSAFLWACQEGHLGTVELVLRHNVTMDINETDNEKITPLMSTCSVVGNTERKLVVAQFLISKKADVSLADLKGYTALIWAASNGHSALVVLLLSCGADMYAESSDAFLPCHYACMYGHVETVKTFLRLGFDVNATSSSRETALISTCRCEPGQTDFDKQTEIARLLCDAGAAVHAENDPGDTPLITASEWDNLPLCLLLISHGADPDKKNHDNQTAYTQVGFGFEENEEDELDLFADQRLSEEDKEVLPRTREPSPI